MTRLRISFAAQIVLTMILVLGATGCSESKVVPDRPFLLHHIRDSSGIRIVEYPQLGPMPLRWSSRAVNPLEPQLSFVPPLFTLEERPFLDIGGARGNDSVELDARHSMVGAAALSNGTIVVNDRTRLLYFSQDGRLLHVAGRNGRGPGEFLQTRSICATVGDTVIVTDFFDARVTLWTAEGKHLATFARPGELVGAGCSPQGALIVRDPGLRTRASDSIDQLVTYRLVAPDGSTLQHLGAHPGAVVGTRAPTTSVVHAGNWFVVGNGRTYELRFYDTNARLVQVTRLLKHRNPLTIAEWESEIERSTPLDATPAWRQEHGARMLANKPNRIPAFLRVVLAPDRRIWVSDYDGEDWWTVFDSTGVIAGRVQLPRSPVAAMGLAGFGSDFVAIRVHDWDHGMRLQLYRFRDSESPAVRRRPASTSRVPGR